MIDANHLSKSYGSFAAVRDVSFIAEDRQVVGLLGPNGAGKTTILKMLTSFHFPSSGDAFVNGHSVTEDPIAVKKCVGYLPENAPLYGDSLVAEYLSFIADARGLEGVYRKERMEQTLAECGLRDVRFKRIDELSKGYRQRVALAQAILHDPPVLILDEPTNGLDPNQIREIRSLIREFGKRKTVVLSTHILQEAEALCSRVLIVHEGRIAAQGTTEEIASALVQGDAYEVVVKGLAVERARSAFDAIPGMLPASDLRAVSADSVSALLTFAAKRAASSPGSELIFDWASASGYKLLHLAQRKASLEHIFARITKDESE